RQRDNIALVQPQLFCPAGIAVCASIEFGPGDDAILTEYCGSPGPFPGPTLGPLGDGQFRVRADPPRQQQSPRDGGRIGHFPADCLGEAHARIILSPACPLSIGWRGWWSSASVK